jgi:hypothetical protein
MGSITPVLGGLVGGETLTDGDTLVLCGKQDVESKTVESDAGQNAGLCILILAANSDSHLLRNAEVYDVVTSNYTDDNVLK